MVSQPKVEKRAIASFSRACSESSKVGAWMVVVSVRWVLYVEFRHVPQNSSFNLAIHQGQCPLQEAPRSIIRVAGALALAVLLLFCPLRFLLSSSSFDKHPVFLIVVPAQSVTSNALVCPCQMLNTTV
jgi:hypothetical protein